MDERAALQAHRVPHEPRVVPLRGALELARVPLRYADALRLVRYKCVRPTTTAAAAAAAAAAPPRLFPLTCRHASRLTQRELGVWVNAGGQ